MKKSYVSMIVLIVMLGALYFLFTYSKVTKESKSPEGLNYVSTFEKGKLYKTADGKFNVLDLHGNFREMGRQYGYLLKDDLASFYSDLSEMFNEKGTSFDSFREQAEINYKYNPDRFKEIIYGMSETSELSLEQLIDLNNAVSDLVYIYVTKQKGCSSLAVWGDYTKDGKMYFGRDWDVDQKLFEKFIKYLAVTVYHPDGTERSLANIEFAGGIYLESAISSDGIVMQLNNAAESDSESYDDRIPSWTSLFAMMFDYQSIDEISAAFNTIKASEPYAVQVADSEKAYSFEWATFGVRKRSEPDDKNYLVAYNSFVPPFPNQWDGLVGDPPPLENDHRRNNYIDLINSDKYKGNIDLNLMKEIMEIPVKDGGALHTGTVFQFIAIPEDNILYLKGIDYSDWNKINLGELFN